VLDGQGRLALHGRTTDVLNINGDKIATEPWEREIRERLGCDEVCILAGNFGDDSDRLHLFLEASRPITSELLTETLRSVLFGFPDVQVHKLGALPRTPLGKVRRFELAQWLQGQHRTGRMGPPDGRAPI